MVDELEIPTGDIRVDKHRISGFWDTPLDSILRNLGCCATTSPDFCTAATIWNVNQCFGFVASSDAVIAAVSAPGAGG